MQKIVINRCYGRFGLSYKAVMLYAKKKGIHLYPDRDDSILIKVIEELKEEANDAFSDLKIVSIPDGLEWIIEEYDGLEWIAEKHRTWS